MNQTAEELKRRIEKLYDALEFNDGKPHCKDEARLIKKALEKAHRRLDSLNK